MSGYTEVEQYVLRAQENKKNSSFPIPIHEFIQSVGLENRMYYNHESSNIPNLFYPMSESSDHFLKIYILKHLSEKLNNDGRINRHENINSIIAEFLEYGYSEADISVEISMLLEKNLIDTDGTISDISWEGLVFNDSNICITLKGAYYLYKGINRFHYCDLVVQDTIITDKNAYQRMQSFFPIRDADGKRDMKNRIISVMLFVRYLEMQIEKIPECLIQKYGNIVDEIRIQGINTDLERICQISMYKPLYDRFLKGDSLFLEQ